MKVRLGGYNELSLIEAEGLIAFAVFFQGCNRGCEGCHNPELQPFDGGAIVDTDAITKKLWANRDYYEAVVFVGGEPLAQPEPLKKLLQFVQGTNMEAWLYTGYYQDEIPEDIFELADVIVAGPYLKKYKTDGFPASANQVIIDNRGLNT